MSMPVHSCYPRLVASSRTVAMFGNMAAHLAARPPLTPPTLSGNGRQWLFSPRHALNSTEQRSRQRSFASSSHEQQRYGDGNSLGATLAHGLSLAHFDVTVADRHLSLVVPESIDAVLDMYIGQGREDLDPYWARPWHSAISLAEELLERPELVKGKTVVDVGAGLGLGGIAAALAGAERVLLLDREPLALQCALLSAMSCGLRCVGDPLAHGPLELASPDAPVARLLAQNDTAEGLDIQAGHLDWLDPVELEGYGRFDVVVACDVLYEDFSVEPMAALLPALLNTRGGDILLADPPERTRPNRERFLSLLRADMPGVRLLEAGRRSSTLDGLSNEVQLLLFRSSYASLSSTIGLP